jgi:DNA-binding CsgD family transcriptional regulator
LSYVDPLLRTIVLSACLVDREGQILEVSEGWKFAAEANCGGTLRDHGVGDNILRHWLSPDLESTILYRGLKKVLTREAPFFAALVPLLGTDGRRDYTIIVAIPIPDMQDRSAILHLDVTSLGSWVPMTSVSRDIVEQLREALADTVHRSIRHEFSLRENAGFERSQHSSEDLARLRKLSNRQVKLLARLAEGASNAEIARSLGISLAAVKAQTTAIMRKLDFENRTQAALFAAKLRLNHASDENYAIAESGGFESARVK